MANHSVKPETAEQSASVVRSGSYISSLLHFSQRATNCAKQNQQIEELRKCTDLELATIGINRDEIERRVYSGELA